MGRADLSFVSDKAFGVAERAGQWGRDIPGRVVDFLFPPLCPFSDERVNHHGTMSPVAWHRLTHLTPPWCEGCGVPFRGEGQGPLCVPCAAPGIVKGRLTGRRRLDRVRSALGYDDGCAAAILALKYGDRHDGLVCFGRLLARAGADVLRPEGTLLVPVPLHRNRLRQRKYNQAGLLAEAVSQETGVPLDHRLLRRIRPTATQKGASAEARARRVAGAFAATRPAPADRPLVLVDDVLTTGATLLACARALRRAGAQTVAALVLARVLPDR